MGPAPAGMDGEDVAQGNQDTHWAAPSDPFTTAGDWEGLVSMGDPWTTDVMASLHWGDYPNSRGDRSVSYRFDLSFCLDGSVKVKKRRGTGSKTDDDAILAQLGAIQLSDMRAVTSLLAGKCKPIKHTFVIEWTRGRPRIE